MRKMLLIACLGFVCSGCWFLERSVDPETGMGIVGTSPYERTVKFVGQYVPAPWGPALSGIALLAFGVAQDLRKRQYGKALRQVADYADQVEKCETEAEVVVAKQKLVAAQQVTNTLAVTQAVRGKT